MLFLHDKACKLIEVSFSSLYMFEKNVSEQDLVPA